MYKMKLDNKKLNGVFEALEELGDTPEYKKALKTLRNNLPGIDPNEAKNASLREKLEELELELEDAEMNREDSKLGIEAINSDIESTEEELLCRQKWADMGEKLLSTVKSYAKTIGLDNDSKQVWLDVIEDNIDDGEWLEEDLKSFQEDLGIHEQELKDSEKVIKTLQEKIEKLNALLEV